MPVHHRIAAPHPISPPPFWQNVGMGQNASSIYAVFLRRVQANIHVVIAMSPIGEAFRARIRNFPCLVNCCAIDWFSAWPKEALVSVSTSFLEAFNWDGNEAVFDGLVNLAVYMHQVCVCVCRDVGQPIVDPCWCKRNYVPPPSLLTFPLLIRPIRITTSRAVGGAPVARV